MKKTYDKAAWAARKAAQVREQIAALPVVPSGDWRGVQRRMATIRYLEAEARRFDRIAASALRAA